MFQIGASLREARVRRGLSSADVQQAIRIRERYLTALEEERWELLPGDAYAKGFLRTYAEFLGLDGDLYVDEWNSRFAHPDDLPGPPLEPQPAGRRRGGFVVPLALGAAIALAVAGVAAWQLGSNGEHPSQSSAPPATGGAPKRTPPAARPAAKKKPAAAAVYAVFRAARGRCWLLVRSGGATGRVLYERVLEQGAVLRLPIANALWVRMGAPWNLELAVAGRAVSGLPTTPANILVRKTGIAPA